MSGWSDEVDPNAVLVGAEAYQRMLDDCDERIAMANSRIDGYEGTRATLKNLLKTCQQELLVPVAGGLGYFDGKLKHTNNVVVLLGENLFAERSVHEALGIAERRIGYLSAERSALQVERKDVVDKQALFVECGAEGSATDSKIMASGRRANAAVSGGGVPSPPKSAGPTAAAAPAPTSKPATAAIAANTTTAAAQYPQYGEEENNAADPNADEDEEYEEYGDDFIDPEDELTIEELTALEDELGEDINDEEKAEAAIMDLIREKKARRLAAQDASLDAAMAQRNGTAAVPTATACAAPSTSSALKAGTAAALSDAKKSVHFDANANASAAPMATTSCGTSACPPAASSSNPTGGMAMTAAATAFASPADIGKLFRNVGGGAGDSAEAAMSVAGIPATSSHCPVPLSTSTPAAASAPVTSNAVAAEPKTGPVFTSNYPDVGTPFPFPIGGAAASSATTASSTAAKSSNGAAGFKADPSLLNAKGGPVRDVIVEKNISGARGAVTERDILGGGLGGGAAGAATAGASSAGVTMKKRSLFGQGAGLK